MNVHDRIINERIGDLLAAPSARATAAPRPAGSSRRSGPALSFIFFSDANQGMASKYQLVFDLAHFADRHGLAAVWTPERHFHPFGGIYSNPAVLAAALAKTTSRIRLRSGSVVLPLHHPTEVVETWAMVDNLSQGRVDLGFASGWNPNDFIISPQTFANLRDVWKERVRLVQKLWRGESLTFCNGKGDDVEIQVYPRPVQPEINVWLAATKRDETFEYAGAQGYN
ncbi:MAG: MupA/Atu3671 family FMN-dependent luciferase-like monooxygenase, partial [Myxococcota bacterium]